MLITNLQKRIVRRFEPRFTFLELLPKNGRVLDCGCGDFVSTNKLMEQRPDLKWHCIDLYQPKEVPHDVFFDLIDLEKQQLPFSDNSFDGIFVLHVMEHISNLELFCHEIQRVLKHNGYVYIEVPSILTIFAPTSSSFFSKTGNFFDDITHKRLFTKSSLNDLISMYLNINSIKVGTARNIIKIIALPVLIIYSFFKWHAFFMTSISEVIGLRIYAIAKKKDD